MPPSEPARTTDVAALALEYGDRLLVGAVRDVHRAISGRAFGATRLVGSRLPESLHDAVVTSIFEPRSGIQVWSRDVPGMKRGMRWPVASSAGAVPSSL